MKIYKSKDLGIIADQGIVTISINGIGNVDKQGDRSLPGSFNQSFKPENLANVYFYKNHDTNETLGVPLKGYESEKYAIVEAKLNLEKEIAKNAFSDYKFYASHQKSVKHSVGVYAIKSKTDDKTGITDVSEWMLKEFSFLTKEPANDETPLLAIKSNDPERLFEYLDDANKYLEWMQKDGTHTHEYIMRFEKKMQILNKNVEQLKALDETEIKEQPLRTQLDYDYIINNLKI